MEHFNVRYGKFSRRRALAVAGTSAAGLATAALIGCSAGGQKASPSGGQSGQPAGAVATVSTDKPKPGGTLRFPINRDTDGIDPNTSAGGTPQEPGSNVYSRLLVFKPAKGSTATGEVVGDLVQRWEQPDPLTLIMHLNPNAKFDEKAPLNGRALNAEDVVKTWELFEAKGFNRANISNKANKAAPVTSVEAIDASTVRMKSAFVVGYLFPLIVQSLPIQPIEGTVGKAIDLTKEMRGTGPFLFDEFRPGIGMKFKKNPKWFHGNNGEKPYIDAIDHPTIPDQAQMEVQFRAKKLHFSSVSLPNVPTFAKELPGTEVAVGPYATGSMFIALSSLPGQPWRDQRVRRALSMMIDRPDLAEIVHSPKELEAAAKTKLPVKWIAPISPAHGAYYLDPTTSEFGPAAQWLKLNPAEATKLLAAAGYSPQKQLVWDMIYTPYYGSRWPIEAEALQAQINKTGIFKTNLVSVDYTTDYLPKVARSQGKFPGRNVEAGARLHPGGGANIDPLAYLFSHWHSGGLTNGVGDVYPELDALLVKQRGITDYKERVAGMHETVRYITDLMPGVPVGSEIPQVDLVWSELRGAQEWNGFPGVMGASSTNIMFPEWWFTKPI